MCYETGCLGIHEGNEFITAIREDLQTLYDGSIATSTKTTYSSQLESWVLFCRLAEVDIASVCLLQHEVQDDVFALFAAFSFTGGFGRDPVGHGTFTKTRMSAVIRYYTDRHQQVQLGSRFRMAVAGFLRAGPINKIPPKVPVNPPILRSLRKYLLHTIGGGIGKIIWGCCLLAFFGLMRPGEIFETGNDRNRLKWRNLQFGYDQSSFQSVPDYRTKWVWIEFEASKGDIGKKGVFVQLFRSSDSYLCPIVAIKLISEGRNELGITDAESFVSVLSPSGDKSVQSDRVSKWLKGAAKAIRLPTAGLSPHCFRVGGATQLHASGASADVIKQRGRWSSEAYQIYLKLTPAMMESLAADLLFDF